MLGENLEKPHRNIINSSVLVNNISLSLPYRDTEVRQKDLSTKVNDS